MSKSGHSVVCPRCSSTVDSRSRARKWDFLFNFGGRLVPYRCQWCQKRFFSMRIVGEEPTDSTPSIIVPAEKKPPQRAVS